MTGRESEAFPYASAQAFGAAITERLKSMAVASDRSVSQLRRQFAYDRLLARLFHAGSQEWILKGGVSMIARFASARHTADVDLVAATDSVEAALEAMHAAATQDLGDFFGFRFEPSRALVQGVPGLRIPTEAWLGPRLFERFGVDLVTGVVITGRPEEAEPLLPLAIPGLVRSRYLLYPLVDSIADKVMAIVETHQGRPSTRFRDLVDLVICRRWTSLPLRTRSCGAPGTGRSHGTCRASRRRRSMALSRWRSASLTPCSPGQPPAPGIRLPWPGGSPQLS